MTENVFPQSFTKFNYLLRPSKQVERKLFIETLQRLLAGGFSIYDYTYLGFGSVYYADFILFHKYLNIKNMICAESENIPKRMNFNRPYEFIDLRMQEVAEVIPSIDREKRYVVWLDYDYSLNDEVLRDLSSLIKVLSRKSIFIITVEADHRFPGIKDIGDLNLDERIEEMLKRFRNQLEKYYDGEIKRNMITKNRLPLLMAQILRNVIAENIPISEGTSFSQLFNFNYADGAQMLSIGGIIGDDETRMQLKQCKIYELDFVTEGLEPVKISVPPLTIREKNWLDQNLSQEFSGEQLAFELDKEMYDSFKKFYKYYPTYYETLL